MTEGNNLVLSVVMLILLLMFHKPKNGGRLDWYGAFPRERPSVKPAHANTSVDGFRR